MISIIICSRQTNISNSLKDNIAATIGCEYELIVIDNSENKFSIFEAYNAGIIKSKGEILCFIHDDINIITQNWGEILHTIFKDDQKIGLIGLAGAKSKTKMPSAWWDCPNEDLHLNIVQHLKNKGKEHWLEGFKNNSIEEVIAIDGVFMAARKTGTIFFNEKMTGFHNYDLNFSFEYLKKGYRIIATKDILLEHFSRGTINKDWCQSAIAFYKLYKKMLPLSLSENSNLKQQEIKNGKVFVSKLNEVGLKKQAFYFWLKIVRLKPVSTFHFEFLKELLK
ncbi:hypothetical protein ASF10_17335 [Flavobacterium sp. Leaf82]|uniref:glycosyltransferase n=1 Tax=unclassified Flavobacterium TaxID=196869 RepID=UPI0006F9EDA9|nr:glycosyltransferase [Flavobacterium sp. Leaf82]KQO20440.1 hypothetical protein ASF10_17335 [Flavobacterium sp. Leaf82]